LPMIHASSGSGDAKPAAEPSVAAVDPAEDLLRRLALNDEKALGRVLTRRVGADRHSELGPKLELLVRLAALLAVGAATPSLREAVEQAFAAGATRDELVDVLVSVGPTIGLASLVVSAERLATAIGYDLENGHRHGSGLGGRDPSHGGGPAVVG
jgi:4-carboxymuconolactone decarboxylase